MLMNHLDNVSVSSMSWYGEDYRQVEALEAGQTDSTRSTSASMRTASRLSTTRTNCSTPTTSRTRR
ncbi:hypothetical protein C496_23698 [Natronorubrum tibetense GA33]|uniref:Uncharacterized protein n=1 Tax=Natronorubrum tibetense GA33 TaxID=1114856 RepID=L9VDE2_9EURY|nr:hypothetical protein C496_23698 [Natronorubrum tibetense GA33]